MSIFFRRRQIPSVGTDALNVPVPIVGTVAHSRLESVESSKSAYIRRGVRVQISGVFIDIRNVGAVAVFGGFEVPFCPTVAADAHSAINVALAINSIRTLWEGNHHALLTRVAETTHGSGI